MNELTVREATFSELDAPTLYERYGYRVTGEEYLDDGIPHVPMTRPA